MPKIFINVMSDCFIYLKSAERKKLQEKLGVSAATLSDALNFRRNSVLARRIRSESVNVYNGIAFI